MNKQQRVFIIAEAGVNHNGDLELAKRLIDEAKKAGADAVKFQTFNTAASISKTAKKADYQKKTTGSHENQIDMIKRLELTKEEFYELKKHCEKKSIMFFSTAFDLDSIAFLDRELNLPFFKVPSGEVTNLPYLIKIAECRKPIIMSTGMCNMQEIKDAMNILQNNGSGKITLLHCTTEYPAPKNEVNLKAMVTMKAEFGCNIGYSDHTIGIEIPIAAVAMGATVIEKHFTLDKNMEGPDHRASLEPYELKRMIDAIRDVESALGDSVKQPSNTEIKNINIARKSIVAKKAIKKGDIFTDVNITTKRPGDGISPMKWFDIIGIEADRDYKEDELIDCEKK